MLMSKLVIDTASVFAVIVNMFPFAVYKTRRRWIRFDRAPTKSVGSIGIWNTIWNLPLVVPANPAERLVSNPRHGRTARDKNARAIGCNRLMFSLYNFRIIDD